MWHGKISLLLEERSQGYEPLWGEVEPGWNYYDNVKLIIGGGGGPEGGEGGVKGGRRGEVIAIW